MAKRKTRSPAPTRGARGVKGSRIRRSIRRVEDLMPEFKKDGTPFPAKRELRRPDGRFKKGSVLNPRGRGAGRIDLVRILAEELAKEIKSGNLGEDMAERRTAAHEIAEHYVRLCCRALKETDQLRAIEGIMDRMIGKPKQTVEAQVTRGSIWDDMSAEDLDSELLRAGYRYVGDEKETER